MNSNVNNSHYILTISLALDLDAYGVNKNQPNLIPFTEGCAEANKKSLAPWPSSGTGV